MGIQLGAAQTEDQAANEPLRLVRTQRISGFTYSNSLTMDSKRNRILAALRVSNEMAVIDVNNGNIIHRIPSLAQPQEILYLPESDVIVIASGGHGQCLFYSAEDFKLLKTLERKPLANCLCADAGGQAILLGYEKSVCTIDPTTFEVTANVVLEGYPGDVVVEKNGKRAFVNLPRSNEVAVIDRATGSVAARWEVPDGTNNNRLALDEANHRLLVACDRPGRLVAFDTNSGSVVATIPIIGGCSSLAYDEAQKRIYAVCAAGTIDVIAQVSPDKYRLDERIPTTPATSGCYSPTEQRLYLLSPAGRGPDQLGGLTVYDTAGNKASPPPPPSDSPK